MDRPWGFLFTGDQWQKIAAELALIGRQDSGGEKASLELIADIFIQARQRTRVGKGLPTPGKARAAWLSVASAAERLKDAITSLETAGAAEFSMLDNHSDAIKDWVAQLPSIAHGARVAAEYEMYVKTPANNADPVRDHFIMSVISTWHGYGGHIRASQNPDTGEIGGPLPRFLNHVIGPVFAAANESVPSAGALRSVIRAAASHPMAS